MSDVRAEQFQVVIKLTLIPNRLRLTYKDKKSSKILMIEELGSNEEVLCSSIFKGRKSNGPNWLVEIRRAYNGIKAKSWVLNTCFVDEYSLFKHKSK